jgi:transposase
MHAISPSQIKKKFDHLAPWMDEKCRRLWAATEAQSLGYGGVSAVAQATRFSRTTIQSGIRELATKPVPAPQVEGVTSRRIRTVGGGRPPITQTDKTLLQTLAGLVAPSTRGDPMRPLLWTCKSVRNLAGELARQGHPISHMKVAQLLQDLGYSLQANRKTHEGASNPDRNAQFEHINQQITVFQGRGQPVISVDTKKKELVGEFKNGGREWRPRSQPEKVNVYDFVSNGQGKAIPYGIYDLVENQGWVSVGLDHDTAEFACASIGRWWQMMGRASYPQATELLVLADGGGSNSSRTRLWKYCLQQLASQVGLTMAVCHFPPATSKWNKIEHRMFCHITQNWRGKPLTSHEVVVNLIGSTTTRTGLKIKAELDPNSYQPGRKISDQQMAALQIERDPFHGEWNYKITPTRNPS